MKKNRIFILYIMIAFNSLACGASDKSGRAPPAADPAQPGPASSADANTPGGSKLRVGETWKQDGFYLTLQDVGLGTSEGTGEVTLSFKVVNNTGALLALALDQRTISVEGSNGSRFKSESSSEDGSIWKAALTDNTRTDVWFHGSTRYAWLGDYFARDIAYLRIIVSNWSRIREAIWQVDIQH